MAEQRDAEWWLDEAALPERIWARLFRGRDGILVEDCDGALHLFEEREEAVGFLREEGYARLEDLQADGELPARLQPPARARRR